METRSGNDDGAAVLESHGKAMDYEQYLYGSGARDAAYRASPRRRLGRMGSLAFVSGVGIGAITVLSIAVGSMGAGDASRTSAADDAPPGQVANLSQAPMTLAVSESPAQASRR